MASQVILSWESVKKIPDYERVAGELLFRRIFELAPGVTSLFTFTKGFEPNSEELYKSEAFVNHATGVIQTVNVAVSMLEPDLDPLLKILRTLGAKHRDYGALPAHYAVVGRALIYTLEQALGDAFTHDVKTAWTNIYDVIVTTMMEGAEKGLEP
jgi:hemoglobin-like flavoprotein